MTPEELAAAEKAAQDKAAAEKAAADKGSKPGAQKTPAGDPAEVLRKVLEEQELMKADITKLKTPASVIPSNPLQALWDFLF